MGPVRAHRDNDKWPSRSVGMKNESLTVGIHLDQIKLLSPGIGLLSVTIRARAVLIVIAIGARTNRRDSLTVKITPWYPPGYQSVGIRMRHDETVLSSDWIVWAAGWSPGWRGSHSRYCCVVVKILIFFAGDLRKAWADARAAKPQALGNFCWALGREVREGEG